MNRVLTIVLLALLLIAVSGCCETDKGSREFIPGKGWVPTS
jgi:hypothetical protein